MSGAEAPICAEPPSDAGANRPVLRVRCPAGVPSAGRTRQRTPQHPRRFPHDVVELAEQLEGNDAEEPRPHHQPPLEERVRELRREARTERGQGRTNWGLDAVMSNGLPHSAPLVGREQPAGAAAYPGGGRPLVGRSRVARHRRAVNQARPRWGSQWPMPGPPCRWRRTARRGRRVARASRWPRPRPRGGHRRRQSASVGTHRGSSRTGRRLTTPSRATEVRASDYVGPGAKSLAGERIVPGVLLGKNVPVLGRTDRLHTWSFTEDVARAAVIAGATQEPGAKRGTLRRTSRVRNVSSLPTSRRQPVCTRCI